MPITGGTYIRTDGTRTGSTVNVTAANAGVKNTAALADARENDLASGINGCLFRDGSNAATDDLDLGSHKITALAEGSASTDAATKGQMDTAIAAKFSVFGASLTLAADAAAARAILTPFPSGTAMLFVQSTAPTGWTKSTTHNDKALRVVSGTASSGGSTAFSTVFASRTPTGNADNHTLTNSEVPTHTHTASVTDPGHYHILGKDTALNGNDINGLEYLSQRRNGGASGDYTLQGTTSAPDSGRVASATTGISVTNANSGSGGAHNHTLTMGAMDFSVQYVDVIIATCN